MTNTTRTHIRQRYALAINRLHGTKIYGYTLPLGAIYGTYITDTSTIKYVFTDVKSIMNTKEKTVAIMIYDYGHKRWCSMELPKTNELIRFIKTGITKLGLENLQPVSIKTYRKERATAQDYASVARSTTKRTRKRQSTALPWNGSPNYYGLVDSSNMTRNEYGEREFREKMKNNILYS